MTKIEEFFELADEVKKLKDNFHDSQNQLHELSKEKERLKNAIINNDMNLVYSILGI